MDHGIKAAEYFLQGYNCAQAIAVAFSDVTGLNTDASAQMISSFGGGMGRLREVCGAVSGMFFVAGCLYGYHDPKDDKAKMQHYTLVQYLAEQFRKEAGSIVCRELLQNPSADPTPTPRTEEFYRQRPCARYVVLAGRILDDYIAQHPIVR